MAKFEVNVPEEITIKAEFTLKEFHVLTALLGHGTAQSESGSLYRGMTDTLRKIGQDTHNHGAIARRYYPRAFE